MKEQIEQRYNALKAEYEAGQKMLADLDARRANLTSTLLRIEGAMQVLKEMLDQPDSPAS
jgi:hypothetical protein